MLPSIAPDAQDSAWKEHGLMKLDRFVVRHLHGQSQGSICQSGIVKAASKVVCVQCPISPVRCDSSLGYYYITALQVDLSSFLQRGKLHLSGLRCAD